MIFQGKSAAVLCSDLKDPSKNGKRSLADLQHHMTQDALVAWGWNPGPGRTLPPLTRDDFVKSVAQWVAEGGPCPAAADAALTLPASSPNEAHR